ncbi:NUDIX domain-containing protein [Nocardiopsis sp. NPDC055551]
MTENVGRSARALLFEGDGCLVLIKRTKTGQGPYWVTVGGGVEPEDVHIEATLRREVLRRSCGIPLESDRRVRGPLSAPKHFGSGNCLNHPPPMGRLPS